MPKEQQGFARTQLTRGQNRVVAALRQATRMIEGVLNMTIPVFDTAAMLAEIRGWVEIESPTTVPAAVNRMVDHVAQSYGGDRRAARAHCSAATGSAIT